MIFKTIADSHGKISVGTNWGNINELFKKPISSTDINAIKAYNAQIDACVTSQTAFNRTMLGASKSAQNMVATANGAKVSIEALTTAQKQSTIASKAASAGLTAFSIALNIALFMAISAAIQYAVKAINDFVHAAEKARDKSTELSNAWSNENASIDDSISKYTELKTKLDDASLSTSEISQLKEELASVQDTLVKKYGQEALQIDLVNGKYDEQIKKLDTLSKW